MPAMRVRGKVSTVVDKCLHFGNVTPPTAVNSDSRDLEGASFHEIGTQIPPEVWIAIDRRARRPNVRYPPLHVVRFSGEALTEGIEEHLIEGLEVRVYSIAKTVADLFKYRHKVGLEVALERCARRGMNAASRWTTSTAMAGSVAWTTSCGHISRRCSRERAVPGAGAVGP